MKKTHKMHLPMALILGILATFIGTSIISGGVGQAAGVIALSIICTAGLGALFWLGISLVAGAFIMLLYNSFFSIKAHSKSSLTLSEIAVMNYVQDAKKMQMGKDDIICRLRENGWSNESIQKAIAKYFE